MLGKIQCFTRFIAMRRRCGSTMGEVLHTFCLWLCRCFTSSSIVGDLQTRTESRFSPCRPYGGFATFSLFRLERSKRRIVSSGGVRTIAFLKNLIPIAVAMVKCRGRKKTVVGFSLNFGISMLVREIHCF